jgi:hypothetical protein
MSKRINLIKDIKIKTLYLIKLIDLILKESIYINKIRLKLRISFIISFLYTTSIILIIISLLSKIRSS